MIYDRNAAVIRTMGPLTPVAPDRYEGLGRARKTGVMPGTAHISAVSIDGGALTPGR